MFVFEKISSATLSLKKGVRVRVDSKGGVCEPEHDQHAVPQQQWELSCVNKCRGFIAPGNREQRRGLTIAIQRPIKHSPLDIIVSLFFSTDGPMEQGEEDNAYNHHDARQWGHGGHRIKWLLNGLGHGARISRRAGAAHCSIGVIYALPHRTCNDSVEQGRNGTSSGCRGEEERQQVVDGGIQIILKYATGGVDLPTL